MRKNTLKYAASLVTGILLTGPAGVFVGLGIDSLAIGLCVEHGDDEEAVFRTVGVIAGMGAGAVVKYADELAELGDDILETAYSTGVKSIDIDDGFKGLNLDDSKIFFKNADDVKPLEKTKSNIVDDVVDTADDGWKASSNTDIYAGVKEASAFLKQRRVPRQYRKQILESFDVRTIRIKIADDSTYGLRFYGGNANAEGRYLFETFSPLTNRNNLALPYEWNSMTDIQQFKVKNDTIMITGSTASQLSFGSQYIGGANQWYISDLEDLIKCQ